MNHTLAFQSAAPNAMGGARDPRVASGDPPDALRRTKEFRLNHEEHEGHEGWLVGWVNYEERKGRKDFSRKRLITFAFFAFFVVSFSVSLRALRVLRGFISDSSRARRCLRRAASNSTRVACPTRCAPACRHILCFHA
jgi:hypothetical protein